MKALVVTSDDVIAWKIAVQPHGTEGIRPSYNEECPYFLEHETQTSCVSGSGGSMCGGFMGSTAGFVYCIWGAGMTTPRPRQSRQDTQAYRPCVLCGVPVLTGQTTDGHTLHLDVTRSCYAVVWANEAKVPTLLPSRAYPVHQCGREGG